MKSDISKEIEGIAIYEKKLDITEEKRITFNLPFENSLRTIIKYRKNSKKNKIYPRKYNEIKNKSL